MACRGCSSVSGCSCSVTGDGVIIGVTGTGEPITSPYRVTFNGAAWMDGLTENNANCATLNLPRVPVILGDGSSVSVPLPCITEIRGQFGGSSFAFTYSVTLTDADPGNGFIRFNSATMSSVTQIFVSDADYGGSNILSWLDAMTVGGRLRIFSITDPTDWAEFTLNSVTVATGYRKLNVSYVGNNGALITAIGDTVISFTGGGAGAAGGFNSVQTIEAVTGTYTLDIGDVGKYLRCSNASAFNVTIPLNAAVGFAVGQHIDFIQSGAGQVTFVGTAGVTINAAPGLKLNGQWAGATLVKVATDTWDLVGNLTS